MNDFYESVAEEVPAMRGNLKKKQVYYYEMRKLILTSWMSCLVFSRTASRFSLRKTFDDPSA
jgi:hypothetical protein